MKCSENHLRICKVVEVNGEIRKPDPCDEFHIVVESCSQRRYYILNASNCFCVELDHLCNETYCVYEEDRNGCEVSYEVDGMACNEACVHFNRQNYHHITIVNHETPPMCYGCLTLRKRVFDVCGRETCTQDCFRVEVVGEAFDETIVLGPSNHYEYTFHDIPCGSYVVSEMGSEDYDVTYVVDGVESEVGNIEVGEENAYMEIWNRMNNGTHILRICKWIRRDGMLVKPDYRDQFDISIHDGYAYREYTLNCENHFCVCIEGNRNDTFVLQELDAQNVEYELDGVIVDEVRVTMNEDHDVRIINFDGGGGEGGMIVLRKWLEEDGRLLIPRLDERFYVRIQGFSEEVFELNAENDFTMMFTDVASGYYNVIEEDNVQYDVSFQVNGVPQEDGYIFVEENGEAFVNIINHQRAGEGGNIHLMKRVNVPCNNEDVDTPQEGSFEVYIEGNEGGDYYILDENNRYEMDYFATPGWYTIYEVNPMSEVSYRLDGVEYHNEVRFYVDGSDYEVMIINHIHRVNFVI